MRNLKATAGLLSVALIGAALTGCAGTKQTLDNPEAAYAEQKDQIPTMVKEFSAPNLAIILGGLRIKGHELSVYDQETTGSMRLADHQAVDLLRETTFEPELCQDKLIATYTDEETIPAAFSQLNLDNHATVVRAQLRSFPSVEEASQSITSQQELAEACPSYTVTAPGGEGSKQTTAAAEFALDGAKDGLLMTYGTNRGEGEPAPTELGVFQRVDNLELRVYFDGSDPKADVTASRQELQDFVTQLGQALIAKAK